MGTKYGRLRGDQKLLIEFRRLFLRGFRGSQEKQQMEQQNGNFVENEEEERCFLAQ
jgi:hypothetical protein